MPINDQGAQQLLQDLANVDAGGIFQEFTERGLIFDPFAERGPTNAVSNARANRAAALRQLGVERKKLEFQRSTGLRDIKQARAKGLEGAVNEALQRGIFRSGITQENQNTVNRDADQEASDLKKNIQFSLDDLAARRQGAASQQFGDESTGGEGPLTQEQGRFFAEAQAVAERGKINSRFDPPEPATTSADLFPTANKPQFAPSPPSGRFN